MKLKKFLCIALSALFCLSLAACGSKQENKPKVKQYYYYEYEPTHESTTRELKFYSSDAELGRVLTEYNERHMRYNPETQIHDLQIGGGRTDWKEWEAMSGSWWNATTDVLPERYATQDIIRNWLTHPNIDAQGYVMPDGGGANTWGLGWAFPSQRLEGGYFYDFAPITDEAGNVTGQPTIDWTVEDDCGATLTTRDSMLIASAYNTDKISLQPSYVGKYARTAPFVQIRFSIEVTDKSAIDDLYIYFKTESDNVFDEKKCAKFSSFCLQGFSLDLGGSETMSEGYFPMYLFDQWGRDREVINDVKIVLKAKEGKTLSGSLNIDWFGTEYDSRHAINPCNYIIAAKEILSFSQDAALLRQVLPNARKAMNYLYNHLNGKSGLISTAYYVGHDNRKSTNAFGIGNGYWDVSSFPDENMYCNLSYYNALKAMEYLELMAEEYSVSAGATYSRNEKMTGQLAYNLNADKLAELIEECRYQFQTKFWNDETGRFHAGIRYDGTKQDNGYLMFNQQAIVLGLPDEQQTKSIMSWINGEREVEGDNSTGEDIYHYEFAPRFCTEELSPDVYWAGIGAFGTNVNNGGTALQLAYYDLVAQAKTDVEKAGERLKTFVNWYKKVEAAGGKGWDFYRDYYGSDVKLQGNDSGGEIGLDYEFLEASIVPRAIPDGFFGLETLPDNTLRVAPNLYEGLHYIKMENLNYNSHYYDLTAGHFFAAVSGVQAYGAAYPGAKLSFVFDEPAFDFAVYLNGDELILGEEYAVDDGLVIVNTDFKDVKVEIKKIETAQAAA